MGKADPRSGNHVVAGALEAGPRRNLASPMRDVPSPILVSSENTLKISHADNIAYQAFYIFRITLIKITYFNEKSSSSGTIVQGEQKVFLITRRRTASIQPGFHV